MRMYLFKRASDIIKNGDIRLIGVGDKFIHYKVTTPQKKEFNVSLTYKNTSNGSVLNWSCDCDYMGKRGIAWEDKTKGNAGICSHIMAVFYHCGGVVAKNKK